LSGAWQQTIMALDWSEVLGDTSMQHAINWFEIPVANLDCAMMFYEAMTGSKLKREAFGAPGEEMAILRWTRKRVSVAVCFWVKAPSQPSLAPRCI
jgi:hypothetical protein